MPPIAREIHPEPSAPPPTERTAPTPAMGMSIAAGVVCLVGIWPIYAVLASPPMPALVALGTLAGLLPFVALSRRGIERDVAWFGLGVASGCGLAALFSIGIIFIVSAAFFAASIAMQTEWPRLTGRGLLLQALGFAAVLLAVSVG